MSSSSQKQKLKCLAAVGNILHQLRCLVSTKLSSNEDNSGSYYNLYFNDDDLSVSEGEETVLSTSQDKETVQSTSQDEETVLSTSQDEETDQSMSKAKMFSSSMSEDSFSTLLSTISNVAPSLIYNRKKAMRNRRKRSKKKICPELLSIWSNAATIVSPVISSYRSTTSYFPTDDWKSVNKRFLSNIPLPSSLPIYGCSINPDDYEDVYERNDYGGLMNKGSKFTGDFPFGSELGFLTDAGPVNVPKDVFQGYTYKPGQGWLLHAEFPRRSQPPEKSRSKRTMRRQRG